MERQTKQVIVIRKDLKMRRGKEIAQGSHASMAFLTRGMKVERRGDLFSQKASSTLISSIPIQPDVVRNWLKSFRKICVTVQSEDELMQVHNRALAAGLVSGVIVDSGATEFGGKPTRTCIAIGPHWEEDFNGITDELSLY